MDSTPLIIALASLLSAVGAVTAALVAAFSLRAQQRMQARQHNLENYWRVTDGWWQLRLERAAAARSLLAKRPSLVDVIHVLNYLERMAHLVRIGELEIAIVDHSLGLAASAWWTAARELIDDQRRRLGTQQLYQDLEWLQTQLDVPPGDWISGYMERQALEAPPPVDVRLVSSA